jgi:hypothetical protein
MNHQILVDRFRGARSDPTLAILEGFHTIKHAIRFGAELMQVVCLSAEELARLTANHAPDIAEAFDELVTGHVTEVPAEVFEQLAPLAPPTARLAVGLPMRDASAP